MIQTKNLTFNYAKHQKESLFKDLTFTKRSGSITGLFGKNGAGKSTLLKLLAGLLYPEKGSIKVNGYSPLKREPDFLSEIFLVSDTPFYPPLSINSYTKISSPLYQNFDSEKMHSILEEFELKGTDKLNEISHGQQKKFIIAFALATNSKLLLLDEPTNGLDIPSKSVFRKVLINSINEDQLVIISTHQVKDIETIIDEIVILDEGKVVFEKDIYSITKKLEFQKVQSISDNPAILYAEKCPGGYKAIYPAKETNETDVDIELLFNAICNKSNITI